MKAFPGDGACYLEELEKIGAVAMLSQGEDSERTIGPGEADGELTGQVL